MLFTFVEPVSDAVEDDPFLPRRRQPEGGTLDIRLVVDVVFKDVDLNFTNIKNKLVKVFMPSESSHANNSALARQRTRNSYSLELRLEHGLSRFAVCYSDNTHLLYAITHSTNPEIG